LTATLVYRGQATLRDRLPTLAVAHRLILLCDDVVRQLPDGNRRDNPHTPALLTNRLETPLVDGLRYTYALSGARDKAHARRRFVEAARAGDKIGLAGLRMIGPLFLVERQSALDGDNAAQSCHRHLNVVESERFKVKAMKPLMLRLLLKQCVL
jgi:hypothetical protein